MNLLNSQSAGLITKKPGAVPYYWEVVATKDGVIKFKDEFKTPGLSSTEISKGYEFMRQHKNIKVPVK